MANPIRYSKMLQARTCMTSLASCVCTKPTVDRCQVKIGIPKYTHPYDYFHVKKNRHPDAHIHVILPPPQSSTAVHAYGRFLLSASTQLLVVQDKFIHEDFTCECGEMVRLGAERVQIFI